jgi:hypothetical protein
VSVLLVAARVRGRRIAEFGAGFDALTAHILPPEASGHPVTHLSSPLSLASCSNAIKFAARRVRLVVSLQLPAAECSFEPASRSSRGLSLLFSPRRGVTATVESQTLLSSSGAAPAATTPVTSSGHPGSGCSMIRFAVEDDGAGIPAEEQALLFKPFAQAVAGIRKQGGTGLGLTICKALVEAHGGEIGFESTSGKHTVFTVDIPFRAAQAASATLSRADAPLLTGGASLTPPAAASPLARQVLSAAPLHDWGSLVPGVSAPADGSGAGGVSGEGLVVPAASTTDLFEKTSMGVGEALLSQHLPFSSGGDGTRSRSTKGSTELADAVGTAASEALSSGVVLSSHATAGVACSVPDSSATASAAEAQLQCPAPLPLLRLKAREAGTTSSSPHALSPAAEGTFSAATDSSAAVVASWSCASSTAVTTPTSSGAASPSAVAHQRYHFLVVDDGA